MMAAAWNPERTSWIAAPNPTTAVLVPGKRLTGLALKWKDGIILRNGFLWTALFGDRYPKSRKKQLIHN